MRLMIVLAIKTVAVLRSSPTCGEVAPHLAPDFSRKVLTCGNCLDLDSPDQGNSHRYIPREVGSQVGRVPRRRFSSIATTATVLIASTIMSLMQAQRQEYLKYPASTPPKSLDDLSRVDAGYFRYSCL